MEDLVSKQLTNAVWRAEQAVTVVDDEKYEEAARYGFTVPRVAAVDHSVLFSDGVNEEISRNTLRAVERKQWRIERERERKIEDLRRRNLQDAIVRAQEAEEQTIVALKNKMRTHLTCNSRLHARNALLRNEPAEHCQQLRAIAAGHHAKAVRYLADERQEAARAAQVKKEKEVIVRALDGRPLEAKENRVFQLDVPGLQYTCRRINEVRALIRKTNEERNRLVVESREAKRVEAEENELNFFKLKYKKLLGRGHEPAADVVPSGTQLPAL